MKTAAAAVALLAISAAAQGHPGIGIVLDSRGNVFYTDLHQVWRVAADGKRSVAVPNVHTHELAIDANDNLYGEHLWYEGDATKKWGHYVWRRASDGRVTKVIGNTVGFLDGFGFVRDRSGTMYWVDRVHSQLKKRAGRGATSIVARGGFREPRWINIAPDGVLYAIDGQDLVRVSADGSVRMVARNVGGYGIWFDRSGNVYVADYANRNVRRVTSAGLVSTFARSTLPWGPTGGVFTPNGDLWLLEYSLTNQARVRRVIAPQRGERPPRPQSPGVFPGDYLLSSRARRPLSVGACARDVAPAS